MRRRRHMGCGSRAAARAPQQQASSRRRRLGKWALVAMQQQARRLGKCRRRAWAGPGPAGVMRHGAPSWVVRGAGGRCAPWRGGAGAWSRFDGSRRCVCAPGFSADIAPAPDAPGAAAGGAACEAASDAACAARHGALAIFDSAGGRCACASGAVAGADGRCSVGSDAVCRAGLGPHAKWLPRGECGCPPGFTPGPAGRCVPGGAAVCSALRGPAALHDGAGACVCPVGYATGPGGACVAAAGTGGARVCAATLGALSEYDPVLRACR